MKEFARKFYNSEKWKGCRQAFIAERMKIDGGVCQICGERPGFIVHHSINLTPENIKIPDITLETKRLRFVCKQCHDRLPGHWLDREKRQKKETKVKILCTFDDQGDLIPPG